MLIIGVLLMLIVTPQFGNCCPSDDIIYDEGITYDGMVEVVNMHNKFRLEIATGQVTKQPRGVNLLRMLYDEVLGEKARVVSNGCKLNHTLAHDSRWNWVGQNIYQSWSSEKSPGQNWTEAVTDWFNEKKYFVYPRKSLNGKHTGHYTQVVWAKSKFVGCDFVYFYDASMPKYPYSKLYTCNYGPGGNYNKEAPYKTGSSGCENLC